MHSYTHILLINVDPTEDPKKKLRGSMFFRITLTFVFGAKSFSVNFLSECNKFKSSEERGGGGCVCDGAR